MFASKERELVYFLPMLDQRYILSSFIRGFTVLCSGGKVLTNVGNASLFINCTSCAYQDNTGLFQEAHNSAVLLAATTLYITY